jgi:hypothetical protein
MRPWIFVAFALMLSVPSVAQELSVAKAAEPPVADIAAPIKALLADDGVTVTNGATALTFWWVKQLPLKEGSGAPAWDQVVEGTIVGAVRVAGQQTDIKGRRIKQPGTYVLRYGIQPANGDHLGVSPFRDFLLLVPIVLDTSDAPLTHDRLVELSPRAVSVSEAHPTVLSLDPPVATDEPLSVRSNAAGHKAVVFEVPTSREGQKLRFGLILVGKIEA